MVHTRSDARKNSFELSVTVCVATLRDCCCVRLRVRILVRVSSSMVLRVLCECVSVRASVCPRLCMFVSIARRDIGGIGF